MANIKSQIKRNRSNEKRRLRNQGVRSELKTRTKNATTAIEAGVFTINLELRTHNEAARVFYENQGYEQLGVVQGYYQGREAALRMSRRLGKFPQPP